MKIYGCLLAVVALQAGCRCRSEKELGGDLVNQKLDFVEGATEALKSRGNAVGRGTAQGLGETIKGMGSGVKDVLSPTVTVTLPPELAAVGMEVNSATATLLGSGGHVEVVLAGKKPFSGGLTLTALGPQRYELGRATAFEHRELGFEQPQPVSFAFPSRCGSPRPNSSSCGRWRRRC